MHTYSLHSKNKSKKITAAMNTFKKKETDRLPAAKAQKNGALNF